MDADEVEMRDRGARQRGQRFPAAGRAVIEPGDEAFHLRGHARRWRRLEMDRALVNGAGDHLHGIGVGAVAADYLDALVSAQQHLMPLEHRLVG
jgi:hypothetical protein